MFKSMKPKWKILTIAIGLLILGGLSYSIVILVSLLNPFPGSVKVDTILIENDEDLIEYDFPGTGTDQEPYRIEDIQLGTHENLQKEVYRLITIKHTTVHIIVQNCTFVGCEIGVFIESVKEGSVTIRNNTFIGMEFQVWDMVFGGSKLIKTVDSENIIITNNNFRGMTLPAIEILKSSNITISKNEILFDEEGQGVGVIESQNIILDANSVALNSSLPTTNNAGIYLKDSQNCLITNNLINNVSNNFLGCYNIEIRNNSLTSEVEVFNLLWFGLTSNVDITHNTFLSDEQYGLSAGNGMNFIISNNTFKGGTKGASFFNIEYSLISYNTFHNCTDYAIWIDVGSFDVTIYHNNFFFNNPDGDSQCYNEDPDSIWYNIVISEGNYWSDLGTNSTYTISGIAGSVDLYPLSNPV